MYNIYVITFIPILHIGYNVCIFAYGQTGSGKTYTMSGGPPDQPEKLGINFRALNDFFEIVQDRKQEVCCTIYSVGKPIYYHLMNCF